MSGWGVGGGNHSRSDYCHVPGLCEVCRAFNPLCLLKGELEDCVTQSKFYKCNVVGQDESTEKKSFGDHHIRS